MVVGAFLALSLVAGAAPVFDNPDLHFAAITAAPSGTYYRSVGLSPDGTKLIAQKSWNDGSSHTEIVLLEANGSSEVVISPGDSQQGDIYAYMTPFWSDDGSTVGFVEVHYTSANRVLAYDVTAGTTNVVYSPTTGDVCNPDFLGSSTDEIVFWQYGPVGGADLFIWDGATATNITNTPDYKEYEPVSNVDGSVILYWSGETTTEPINTTHILVNQSGTWAKDIGFTPIPDSYWPFWTGRADNLIGLTQYSTKDVEIYDANGTFVMDLTGPGYEGGAGQWNFFGFTGEGPLGEFVITSNALRGLLAGRDIVIAAPRSYLFVDATGGSDAYPGTWQAPFATIAKGILEVSSGGTVNVGSGTYEQLAEIAITDDLTLVGADRDTTIVTPDAGFTGSYLFRINDGTAVLTNLTLDGLGDLYGGVRFTAPGTGVVDGNLFKDIQQGQYLGIGLVVYADGVTVSNNDFSDMGRIGVWVGGQNALVTGNTYVGKGAVDGLDYGVEVGVGGSATISGNTITDCTAVASSDGSTSGAIMVTTYYGLGTAAAVELNVLQNNSAAILVGYDATDLSTVVAHYNSISGNAWGIDTTAPLVDATLNWWGDASGPSGEGAGSGDAVSANVIYSPWLGIDPDADPLTAGVQLVSPMLLIVADVDPAPTAGHLNVAIEAANVLLGHDTIRALPGTYNGDEPIMDGVTIVNGGGAAAGVLINGPMDIRAGDILLGGFRNGMTIDGPIGVAAGVDASTIHINWNNLYGVVTNGGNKALDATYNYWGADGVDTVGNVRFRPLLPEDVDTVIGYIDTYGLSVQQAIALSNQITRGLSGLGLSLVIDLMREFGFPIDQAAELVKEYGVALVLTALGRCGGDYDEFLVMLIGYGAPAGGGAALLGGGAGGSVGESGLPVFHVGETVPLVLPLVHPITGEPMDEAFVTYTVGRQLEDGSYEIVLVGAMTYDGDLGAFTFDLDTTGLVPGIYDIYLGSDDGRSQHLQIEIAP